MPPLDAKLARLLAARSVPNLRFSNREQFFPIRAESWLTHATSAPWDEDPDDVAALPVDPHLRGTALLESDGTDSDIRTARLAGPPNADDSPLRLTTASAPDAIGNPEYAKRRKGDLFLSFAGWQDPAAPQRGGDLDYLFAAFSELASALDHRLAWDPPAQQRNRPTFAHAQPTAPAVYCEVDWAAVHPDLGLGDFADGAEDILERYVQVTYHYLFPARQALAEPPQAGVRPLEGQWAAISLFHRASEIGRERDDTGRPTIVDVDPERPPEYVALSLDPLEDAPTSVVLRWGAAELERFPGTTTIAAYVGAGTHRFFPQPSAEAVVDPPPAWPPLDYEPGGDWEGLTLIVIPALIGAIAAIVIGTIAAIALISIGVGVATAVAIGLGIAIGLVLIVLIALVLLWLLVTALCELWDDDADKGQIPDAGDAPVSGGPSAGDPAYGEATPAGDAQTPPDGLPAGTGPGGGADADPTGWWPTHEGSDAGWDIAFFDAMVISRFGEHVREDPTLGEPAWWRYAGRWGIKVPDRIDREWESGTRRIDADGRGWAYWHSHALVNAIVLGAPGPTGP